MRERVIVTEIELNDLLGGGWRERDVRAAVAARIERPMEDYLRNRLRDLTAEHAPEAGPARSPSALLLLRAAAAGAEEPRRRALRSLLKDLVGDLDRLFVEEALANGDPFGTAGYERAVAAIRAGEPIERGASEQGEDVRTREEEVLAAVEELHQALAVHLLRGRRVERARARLGVTVNAWVAAQVESRMDISVQGIESRLSEELQRRIGDREQQRVEYARTHLRPPEVAGGEVRRRPTYAGRPVSEPRPGARLPLEGGEWDELARHVVGMEPAFLLAAFARQAAGEAADDPALASTLAQAPAAEVRRRYEAWVHARMAAEITSENGLTWALAFLSEPERQQRIRSLIGRGAPTLRGQRDASVEVAHIAAFAAGINAALPVLDLVQGAVHIDEFVDVAAPDRIDLVSISRGQLDAAEIMTADDARQLAERLEDVVEGLPTEQIRELVRRHGLLAPFGPGSGGGPEAHPW